MAKRPKGERRERLNARKHPRPARDRGGTGADAEPEGKRRVLKLRECESALRRAVGILPRLDSAPYGSPSCPLSEWPRRARKDD